MFTLILSLACHCRILPGLLFFFVYFFFIQGYAEKARMLIEEINTAMSSCSKVCLYAVALSSINIYF